MNRLKWFILSGLCVLAVCEASALMAAAAEAEGGGWGWLETIGRWFNLAVLFGLIAYAVRQPAREFFANRRSEIQREMREAQEARKAAEKRMAEIEARMENLDAELEKIRAQGDQEARAERERILEMGKQESEKVLAQAKREIEGLGRSLRKDLQEYMADLAVELAEEQLRSKMTQQTDERLMERFFAGLSSQQGGMRQ